MTVLRNPMRVWTYVITYDDGGAPNFDLPATTLTVCKPNIRRAARPGHLVLAFNGARLNPAEPHSVRWAGVVSEVIPMKDYWNDLRFQDKKQGRAQKLPDNIYRPTNDGRFEQVPNATHKPDALARDVGGMNALALSPSWHFGEAVAVLPTHFKLRMIGGRRNHRLVEIDEPTWRELKQWLDDNVPESRPLEPSIKRGTQCAPQPGKPVLDLSDNVGRDASRLCDGLNPRPSIIASSGCSHASAMP
jgi:hypothetical protein